MADLKGLAKLLWQPTYKLFSERLLEANQATHDRYQLRN